MISTFLTHDSIGRGDTPKCLSDFLEVRLRVDEESFLEDMMECREDMFLDKCICDIESMIQIECSDNRLECIREDIPIILTSCE